MATIIVDLEIRGEYARHGTCGRMAGEDMRSTLSLMICITKAANDSVTAGDRW